MKQKSHSTTQYELSWLGQCDVNAPLSGSLSLCRRSDQLWCVSWWLGQEVLSGDCWEGQLLHYSLLWRQDQTGEYCRTAECMSAHSKAEHQPSCPHRFFHIFNHHVSVQVRSDAGTQWCPTQMQDNKKTKSKKQGSWWNSFLFCSINTEYKDGSMMTCREKSAWKLPYSHEILAPLHLCCMTEKNVTVAVF